MTNKAPLFYQNIPIQENFNYIQDNNFYDWKRENDTNVHYDDENIQDFPYRNSHRNYISSFRKRKKNIYTDSMVEGVAHASQIDKNCFLDILINHYENKQIHCSSSPKISKGSTYSKNNNKCSKSLDLNTLFKKQDNLS